MESVFWIFRRKIFGENFENPLDKFERFSIIIAVQRNTAGLCKGSTADSDSVCEGSNPSPAAKRKRLNQLWFRRFSYAPTRSSFLYACVTLSFGYEVIQCCPLQL